MSHSFFDSWQEFEASRARGKSSHCLPLESHAERADGEMAVVSALGAQNLELEWFETPRIWCRLIEQADVCLEHARLTEKGLRFSAACGLILTAQELLRRSLNIKCSANEYLTLERAVNERLEDSCRELDRLLDLSVQMRLFAI